MLHGVNINPQDLVGIRNYLDAVRMSLAIPVNWANSHSGKFVLRCAILTIYIYIQKFKKGCHRKL